MHPDQKVDRALRNLASNDDLKIVLTSLKDQYIQTLTRTSPTERELREECYFKVMTLDDLQTWVENHENG